jgi:hypothetical protein
MNDSFGYYAHLLQPAAHLFIFKRGGGKERPSVIR